MKLAIVIPDGAADEPQAQLDGKTPLQAARKPCMNRLAREGKVGRANHVPLSQTPASDVATLSLFGYDPLQYYTGRAPLEAAAQGIELTPDDWAIRCNLVTIENGRMADFTAGHISSEEGQQLIACLQQELGSAQWQFHAGVSYRNLLIYRGQKGAVAPFSRSTRTQPPHDIPDQPIAGYLPEGPGAELLRHLMERSRQILAAHPVNEARRRAGKKPATQIWLWGLGQAAVLPSFEQVYGRRGAIISAVDLVRGVGALLGWHRIDVPGATGYLDTNYANKGSYACQALADFDMVCVHVEAPDEASHEGNLQAKIQAIEAIDEMIVGPLLDALQRFPSWRILVSPDHRTPLRTRAHAHGPVPFVLAGAHVQASHSAGYDETVAAQSALVFDPGWHLMRYFLRQD
ncbi:MAG: cofactor-independent phosphoglycerate mutase [Gemmataceae bacterium]